MTYRVRVSMWPDTDMVMTDQETADLDAQHLILSMTRIDSDSAFVNDLNLPPVDEGYDAPPIQDDDDMHEDSDLGELTKAEIKDKLETMELPTHGNKQELRQRLEDALAEEPEAADPATHDDEGND